MVVSFLFEMITLCYFNPTRCRDNSMYGLFLFPLALFDNIRDEQKKNYERASIVHFYEKKRNFVYLINFFI